MKRNATTRVISLVIALMMIIPTLMGNAAFGISGESTLTPGTVALTKEAKWVDEDNRIAEIKFTVKGEPVKTAVDVVLVVDRSGSMGFGWDERYSPCTNPNHWDENKHTNDNTGWFNSSYNKDYGCTDRMDDAKNAAKVFLSSLLDNNVADEYGNKNRVALVPFNNSVSFNVNDFTDVKSTIQNKINGLTPDNGTNYTDALNKAREYIKQRNINDGLEANVNSRPTFIVMLSDGRPEPSNVDGKSIADNLKAFTGEPLTIFTLGLNMLNNDAEVLKYIATNGGVGGYYKDVTNTGSDLQPFLEEIASLMKPAGTNATLQDVISQYFDYYEDSTYKPNKTIIQSGKNITWNIGTITKEEVILTFYVRLGNEYNISGTYPTNASASLSYTPVGNNPGTKVAESPNLSVITGSITINYLLVDENTGKYIADDGNQTDDIAFAKNVGGEVLSNLELTTYTVVPEAPAGYLLYSDAIAENITLTEGEKDKVVNFKVYVIPEETYEYTINYYIKNTEDKVPGITPNPITGEDVAGKVITIVHPSVTGYKVMDGQPTSLVVTTEGAVETVYYEVEAVSEEDLDYTVEYYKDGVLFETTSGSVPVSDPIVEYVSTDNRPDGYITSYESTDFPFTVTKDNNVIKIYYINESGNTISYIINYYMDGDEEPFDSIVGTVESEDPVINSVPYDNMPDGYHLDEEYSTNLPFTASVESENIIKVYYVKNNEEPEEPILENNVIIVKHYTKTGTAARVLAKTDTPISVTTSSTIYGAVYKDNTIVSQGFTFNSSDPEFIDVYPRTTTESAIRQFVFELLYTKSDSSGGGDSGGNDPGPGGGGSGGGGGTIIPDTVVPLAELEKTDHFAYVIGYPEGDVRPLNNITREEVAMIFYRLLTDDSRDALLSDTNPFTDMDGSRWSNRAVSTLYNADIISGYPDGTFRPSAPISRAEFATIAAKFDDLSLENATKFTDITGHWAEKYITSSENKGWIKGYPDMTFKPQQDITRAEAMTLINNVLERKVPEENIHPDAMFWPDNPSTEWYYEAVMEATNSHDYVIEEDGDELWTGMKPNKIWP